MKGLTVTAVLLALGTAAIAKPTPVKNLNPVVDLSPAVTRADVDINSGPAGAMLEREYFEAPRPTTHDGLPCHFQSTVFDKVRLAQVCR